MVGTIHQSLKVETLERRKDYAITLSPELQFIEYNKKNMSFSYKNPHKLFIEYVKAHVKKCEHIDMELFYELSPLGIQHLHGLLSIEGNVMDFVTRDLQVLKTLGALCIKEIDNWDKWREYCLKQKCIHMYDNYQKIMHTCINSSKRND